MCYHIKQTTALDILAEKMGLNEPKGNHQALFEPQSHINGYTFSWVPIVTNEHPKQMRLGKWWLMPSWEKEWSPKLRNTLNTRVEKIEETRSMCYKYQENHATLLVDGFYEWQHVSSVNKKGKKEVNKERHMIIMPKGDPFHLACLFADWYYPDLGKTIKTVSILTRPANSLMRHIHNTKKRMPVVLDQAMAHEWLEGHLEVNDFIEMDDYFEELPLDALKR